MNTIIKQTEFVHTTNKLVLLRCDDFIELKYAYQSEYFHPDLLEDALYAFNKCHRQITHRKTHISSNIGMTLEDIQEINVLKRLLNKKLHSRMSTIN